MGRLFTGVMVISLLIMGFVAGAGTVGFISANSRAANGVVAGGPAVAVAPVVAPVAQQKPAAREIQPEVRVVSTEMKFSLNALAGRVGQPLKVILENKGVIEHDITFPGLPADKPATELKVLAKPGQTVSLELTPAAKGNYEYFCTIPGHKEAGMRGNLGVIE